MFVHVGKNYINIHVVIKIMDTEDIKNEIFRQNLSEKGEFQHVFRMELLFKEKGVRPDAEVLRDALVAKYGKTDIVTEGINSLSTFAVRHFS